MNVTVKIKGIKAARRKLRALQHAVTSGDALAAIEGKIHHDLSKVGTGWPTGRVRAALDVQATRKGIVVSFSSVKGNPSSLKPHFIRAFNKNAKTYEIIIANYLKRIIKGV